MNVDSTLATAGRTHPDSARVVELDVRDDLRSGREPFARIMGAVGGLQDQEVLLLRTTFEPAPLFGVLGKRGFVHESVGHAADDWSVWFWRPAPDDAGSAIARASRATPRPDIGLDHEATPPDTDAAIRLDVRGLEPPEPLMRTLTALETLPPGQTLVQVNDRVPQLLFPMLAERGFAFTTDESRADCVLVRIWRAQ